ncbi:MAG: hypothetical protein ACHQCF_05330 [Solirubrobacterales bacterium]
MSTSSRLRAALGALVAVAVAVGALAGSAAATRTVTIPTSLKISVYAYRGKVSSPNHACASERTVVLKQVGHGVLGRTESTASGKWEVPPEELHYKGPLPYRIFAEVKTRSEGAAGTIYKCLGATSKTITISGG